jgi:hypothetical protein
MVEGEEERLRQAELSELKDSITATIRATVGNRLKEVVLEADRDEYGSDFLRVVVELDNFDGITDENMESLISKIEIAVDRLDERFPSVRFADAV